MGEEKFLVDTHVLIWMLLKRQVSFSRRAKEIIATHKIYYSPISVLELRFLEEKGRLNFSANRVITELIELGAIEKIDTSFDKIVKESLDLSWTRDVFDRLLVGHSILLGIPLLTKDRTIRSNFDRAVW